MNDDGILIKQCSEGNESAYEVLFKKYYSRLCGFAYQFLKDPQLSEEFVQDTFVKLWEQRDKLTEVKNFEGYVFRALRNDLMNHFQKEKVRSKYVEYGIHAFDNVEINDGYQQSAYSELEDKVAHLIAEMPEKRRAVYQKSREEGLSYKETAEALDVSIKTVENHMGAALKYLRENLSEYAISWVFWIGLMSPLGVLFIKTVLQ